jgi:hypothetical protein
LVADLKVIARQLSGSQRESKLPGVTRAMFKSLTHRAIAAGRAVLPLRQHRTNRLEEGAAARTTKSSAPIGRRLPRPRAATTT